MQRGLVSWPLCQDEKILLAGISYFKLATVTCRRLTHFFVNRLPKYVKWPFFINQPAEKDRRETIINSGEKTHLIFHPLCDKIKVNHGLSIYLTMPLNWAGRHRYQKTDYHSFSVVSGKQKTKSLPNTCLFASTLPGLTFGAEGSRCLEFKSSS